MEVESERSSGDGRRNKTPPSRASSSDSNTLDEFQIYQRFRLKVVSTFGSMAAGLFEFGADPETGRISRRAFVQICSSKLEMMSEKEATLLFLHFTNADPWSGSVNDYATYKDLSITDEEWAYVVASKQEAKSANSTAIPFSSAPSGVSTGLYHRSISVNQVSEQRTAREASTPMSQGNSAASATSQARLTKLSSSSKRSVPWRQQQKPWAPSVMAGMDLPVAMEAKTALCFRPRLTSARPARGGLGALQGTELAVMARSYYDRFEEVEVGDSMGESTPPPTFRWRRHLGGGTGGLSSGEQTSPDFSGYESEEKTLEPGRPQWDGWAEDGSWGGRPQEAFGMHRGSRGRGWRKGFNENWSWKSSEGGSEPPWRGLDYSLDDRGGAIQDYVDASVDETEKGKIKVAGAVEGADRKSGGKVSNTYPPVFRARPQESYQEWKRAVEFWIGGEGLQLPQELIGPRMMVLQLSRAAGESMESYITRAGVYRSRLLGVDPTMAMGEAFYVGHLVDHARLTKRDRAMIKTKAGDFTDECKVTTAMVELASELDGEPGYAVGQSEPALARNGEEWLLQREGRGGARQVSGQPGGRGLRGVFVAEQEDIIEEEPDEWPNELGEQGHGEVVPPELLCLENEAFGTQYKAKQKIAEVKKLRQYYQKARHRGEEEVVG
ncbi:hypothetical protein AK812_SmicGene26425 [Symbiodinium microadriaticum]|uniref:Uncharacterized protein n=1 Tax=Symbiodinium microadriaticum TaxID=2951 RepID=A0A1Q9D9J8_SYMMI|nr:hypothetical protein AK812_SmicGene26425 [Symbiodinium microadriaticum]